jgi:hypothetical protein
MPPKGRRTTTAKAKGKPKPASTVKVQAKPSFSAADAKKLAELQNSQKAAQAADDLEKQKKKSGFYSYYGGIHKTEFVLGDTGSYTETLRSFIGKGGFSGRGEPTSNIVQISGGR